MASNAGFQIFPPGAGSGGIISQDYENLVLHYQGDITVDTRISTLKPELYSYAGSVTLPAGIDLGSEGVVALRLTGGHVGLGRIYPTGGQWVVELRTREPATVSMLVFSTSGSSQIVSTHGMQVFDSGSVKTFDSRLNYMRVVNVRSFDIQEKPDPSDGNNESWGYEDYSERINVSPNSHFIAGTLNFSTIIDIAERDPIRFRRLSFIPCVGVFDEGTDPIERLEVGQVLFSYEAAGETALYDTAHNPQKLFIVEAVSPSTPAA